MKKDTCDICKCKKSEDCKIFTIQKRNSNEFDKIKTKLNLHKNELYICENHYPPHAIKNGKKGKELLKEYRDRVPTENFQRSNNNSNDEIVISDSKSENTFETLPRDQADIMISRPETETMVKKTNSLNRIHIVTVNKEDQRREAERRETEQKEVERRERFLNYRTVQRNNWWLEADDDQIIFKNSTFNIDVTVTPSFRFTVRKRNERNEEILKKSNYAEITNQELYSLLASYEFM